VTYMSPEQAEGKRVDARSDIFSFGSVLYEVVTGRKAFQKDSKTSTLGAVIHKEPEHLGANIPHDLEKIITRCLRKEPARRFQHIDDVKVALEELKEESDSGKLAHAIRDAGKPQKTIAVLPFANLSPDRDQEYFVDGLSEEVINSLAQISDLTVIARTSSFTFKGSNKKVQEIAKELGVDHILEGSARKAGNALRITARLIRAKDDVHLWSKTYDRELKDIFAVQEDIAAAVANELKVKMGMGKSLKQLGGTNNERAHELYLIAKGQSSDFHYAGLIRALESIDAAIALDPEFALAWANKAYMHNLLMIFSPANHLAAERNEALIAAEKSIELEPNLADGHYQLSFNKLSRSEFIEAEFAVQKGMRLKTGTLGSMNLMGGHYLALGYFKKADEFLGMLLKNDPLNKIVRDYYMLNIALCGDIKRAEDEYKRNAALLGSIWPHANEFITNIRLGTGDVVSDNIVFFSRIHDMGKEYLDSPKDGLVALHRIYANSANLSAGEFMFISVWAAYFGDLEFAMAVLEKGVSIEASGLFHIWLPVMKEVRQTPRFKAFVKKIGLVDYWKEYGWPDLCRQTDGGDFECD